MIFGSRSGSGMSSGRENVVSMNRFRKGGTLSPLRQAEAYWTALRRGDEIYVEHENGEREWYDLAADPFQLENGYDSLPADVQAELAAALAALKECTGAACWAG